MPYAQFPNGIGIGQVMSQMTMSDSLMALIITAVDAAGHIHIAGTLAFDAQFIEYRFYEFAVGLVKVEHARNTVA